MFNILVFLASVLPYIAISFLLIFVLYRLYFVLSQKLNLNESLKVVLIPFSLYFLLKYYKKQKLYIVLVIIGTAFFLAGTFSYWYVRYL
jgi:hypothetical protein